MTVASVDVIFTGRPDLTAYAVRYGYLRGARLDKLGEFDDDANLEFLDLHWEDPRPDSLLDATKQYEPKYVVAGDYDGENHETINERARELRPHAEHVIVVPHHDGDIQHVPEWAVIGYSVPSEYAATEIALREYQNADQPIHILGGTPHDQLDLLGRLWAENVLSMDCNSHHKAATIGSKAWFPRTPRWRRVEEGENRVERAYRTSVENLHTEYQQRGIV